MARLYDPMTSRPFLEIRSLAWPVALAILTLAVPSHGHAQEHDGHDPSIHPTGTPSVAAGVVDPPRLSGPLTTNVRVRYNFSEGRDLWLVWNEGLNLEREVLGRPRLPCSEPERSP